MFNYKKLWSGFVTLLITISMLNVFTVNAVAAPKFVVLQDFENISAADAVKGHEMFGSTSQYTAEIATDWKVDGGKSLKLSGSPGSWEYRFFTLDTSGIDLANMSAIMVYFKTDDTCTNDGGKQLVAKFGVWTSDGVTGHAYFSNDLGQVFDAKTNQFLPDDFSGGQKSTIWFSDARNREIAVKIPTVNMLKNADEPGEPDIDYSKITHLFMASNDPANGKALYIDRIVGIEGENDGSLGFAPQVEIVGAPEVTPNLFMLQNFDSFPAGTDLAANSAVASTPRKGSWKQNIDTGAWYFDGTIGTGIASDTFKGIGGMSAKFDFPDGMMTWGEGESAFKAPVQQYGPINEMSGVMMYVKMPSKPSNAVSDRIGFKTGFEGPKGADYLVFGLADGNYVRILNASENQWRYVLVEGNDVYLPYDWEGYIQIPYSYLTITYPAAPPVASLEDSDFSPIIYGYVEAVGGEYGAFYIDDIMAYAPSYDTSSTAFIPSDWLTRDGKIAGTLNIPTSSEISVEDILFDINNTDKTEILISVNSPVKVPKEILAALKGKDKNLVMQVMDGENVLYSWTINGNDVTDTSKDFEMNNLINGSIFQDKITDITKFIADNTLFITTVEDILPGKMTLRIFTGEKFETTANVFGYNTDEENVFLVKKDATVTNGYVSFEITKGGEYFLSASTYESSTPATPTTAATDNENSQNPSTGDKGVIVCIALIMMLSLTAWLLFKKKEFMKEV